MKAYLSRRLRRLMAPIFVWAVVATSACVLSACGGGGGGSSSGPQLPPPQPVERTEPLRYGYFGSDGDQLRETADHVTFFMAPDWGPLPSFPAYDSYVVMQTITALQEARARGVREAWVMVPTLLFEVAPGNCTLTPLAVRPDAIPRLQAFMQQLAAVGLLDYVKVVYPVDEPELHCLSDASLTALLQQVKAVWPQPKLAMIYGDTRSYPGLAALDLAGKDNYGAGAGVLNQLPPLTGAQQHLLVPGGSSGLSGNGPDAIAPFYEYAQSHANVYAIVPFVWFDRTDERGRQQKGIRSNGMAPSYIAVATKIKEQMP